MTISNYIISIIGSSITVLMELLSYSKIRDGIKLKFNIRTILLLLLIGGLVTLNIYSSNALLRTFISFILTFVSALILFKESISKTLFYSFTIYIICMMYELILSFILTGIKIDLKIFDTNMLIKCAFSFTTMLFAYLTCYINKIKILLHNIELKINKKIIIIISSFCLVLLVFADFKYISTVSMEIYYVNIVE